MNPLKQFALSARCTITAARRQRQMQAMCAENSAPMMVLFYHRVADTHPNGWTISCSEFERHVEYCREHFDLIGLDEVQRRVRENDSHRPGVTFTFDDGYAENCRFALPLLIRYRIPTVYFVSTGHIRSGKPFAHDVQAGQPLAVNTVEELRSAADGGIEIGLHTRNHVDFSKVTDLAVIRREICEAKDELEQMIGRSVRYFAVPFGMPEHLTREVIEMTTEAGLSGFCSAFGAYNLVGRDAFHIRRIHGDPEFARLKNWLTYDRSKLVKEPEIRYGQSISVERPTQLCIEQLTDTSL